MKERMEVVLETTNKISKHTGFRYSKKLLDKAFKGKSAPLVILTNSSFPARQIGTVSKIKVVQYEDKVTISGVVKTSLGITAENLRLTLGVVHDSGIDRANIKAKDIQKLYFYFVDEKVEAIANAAKEIGLNLHTPDGKQISTAQYEFDELFENKKSFVPNTVRLDEKA